MDRSRSKRNYYHDQDYDSEALARTKPRYHHHSSNNTNSSSHSHHYRRAVSGSSRSSKFQETSAMVTTNYRILCHEEMAGSVVGKSGSIFKAIRQHTGAWINVHELVAGDQERIIEISDSRRRDPEGRMPSFSPAQEALFLIHERILESASEFKGFSGEDEDGYAPRGGVKRVATRLVVSRVHVGCLLGKGGKIIEQMRMETKTQIRVLPRDHTLPQCVTISEEIVQVVGDVNAVKNAIAIISSRLRESQHRDRTQYHGRAHSPDRFIPDDDFTSYMNSSSHRASLESPAFVSRSSTSLGGMKSNNYASHSSDHAIEAGALGVENVHTAYGEDLVFRILCPVRKVDSVVGESDGIINLLRHEIGVDILVADPLTSSDEQIIIISSEEGPDDELFPAQEALLHIQNRIIDHVPDGENIVTTRLLVPASDVGCLGGKDGSLNEMKRSTGADIQILAKEELPACIPKADELVQIVGEIKAAREALVEVTSRLRSHLYRDFFQNNTGLETTSHNYATPVSEGYSGTEPPSTTYQNVQATVPTQLSRESGGSGNGPTKSREGERREDVASNLNRQVPVPLVTRSILEIVIPEHAVSKLITKSKNRLAQFSELSGAKVTLVEDRPEATEKIIQMSGTPEQVDKAQSLLQGFILSTQEDTV